MDKQDIIEEITLDLILSNDTWVGDGAKIAAANIYKAYIEPLKLAVERKSEIDRYRKALEEIMKTPYNVSDMALRALKQEGNK